ncbi:MAG TPA: PIG-L family deacetylase [Patescibacteria group bacterium]
MHNPLFALAIIAHPDDESFLLAGTSLKFAEEGKSVGVICATRGEKGADRLNRNLTEQEMAEIRSNELGSACNILKCSCTEFGNYHDGSLDKENFDELVAKLVQRINYYQPKIILTFGEEGISGHRDHIVIGKAALAAATLAAPKPQEVWLASMPESVMDKFYEHLNHRKVHHSHFQEDKLKGVPDKDLLFIDIRKFKDLKLEALKAHQSQYIPNLTFELFLENEYFEVVKLK